MLFSGLVGFIYMQHKHSLEKASWYEALNVAEAGLNYYRWHLAHNPDDLQDGTGGAGPYEHIYIAILKAGRLADSVWKSAAIIVAV